MANMNSIDNEAYRRVHFAVMAIGSEHPKLTQEVSGNPSELP